MLILGAINNKIKKKTEFIRPVNQIIAAVTYLAVRVVNLGKILLYVCTVYQSTRLRTTEQRSVDKHRRVNLNPTTTL